MAIRTRKPTGLPSWPVLLIAGAEGSGKSWGCALASASPKVGRTYWLSVGETDPDAYAAIPGANFDIVEHNGTAKGIQNVLQEIAAEPAGELPTLLVVDSMSRLWEMITDDLQATADKRKYNPGQITMDLWNKGKNQWSRILRAIQAHQGPVILTARLETVTVMGDDGKPKMERNEKGKEVSVKADKVKAEKSLPYDVDAVVHMPQRGIAVVTKVRSVVLQLQEPTIFPNFTVDGLWDALGLNSSQTAQRTVSDPAPAQAVEDPQEAAPVAGGGGYGIGAALGKNKPAPVTEATLTRIRQGLHALNEGTGYIYQHTGAQDPSQLSEAEAITFLDQINADFTARQK